MFSSLMVQTGEPKEVPEVAAAHTRVEALSGERANVIFHKWIVLNPKQSFKCPLSGKDFSSNR
jgi:hypothetical protein